MDNLSEVKSDEIFCFGCDPEVPCFNRCCAELTLPLTPYDVLCLRRKLTMSSEDFLQCFTTMRSFPNTGFPLPMLCMLDGLGDALVTPVSRAVYEDRPGAVEATPWDGARP